MHKQTDYNKNTETYAQKSSDRQTDRFRQKQGSCRKSHTEKDSKNSLHSDTDLGFRKRLSL